MNEICRKKKSKYNKYFISFLQIRIRIKKKGNNENYDFILIYLIYSTLNSFIESNLNDAEHILAITSKTCFKFLNVLVRREESFIFVSVVCEIRRHAFWTEGIKANTKVTVQKLHLSVCAWANLFLLIAEIFKNSLQIDQVLTPSNGPVDIEILRLRFH